MADDTVYVSPEDKAMGVYSPKNLPETNLTGTVYEPQKDVLSQNFQDTQSTLSAQNPAPMVPTGEMSVQDTINNAVPQLLQNAAVLSQNKGIPLDESNAKLAVQGTPVIPEAYKGTAASVQDPSYVPPQQIATAGTSASQLPAATDPFAGSNALAIQGIKSAEKAGAEAAIAEHSYFQKKADAEALAMDKQEKLQEAFEFKFQEKLDGYEQTVREFKDLAGEKIVPGAFLARQDTQGSLMTGLAIALGGIGGALQGTNKNIGLEMIEKAIDRDVAAQQFNAEYKYKVKGQDLQNQSSLLSKMREKFSDDKSAILATKAAMLDMVQSKMNMELTKKGGARDLNVQAQAQTAMAQIIQRKELYTAQLKAEQAKQYEKQQMMQGVDYYNMSNEQALQHFGKDADKYVRGYGMATDPQLAKDFIQKVKPAEATIQKVKDLLAFSEGKSYTKISPEDRARMSTMLTDLQLDLKSESAYALGVLTGPDMDLLNQITGNPNSFNPLINSQSRLKELIKISQKKFDSKVKSYGFEPVSSRPGSVDSLVKPVAK